MKKVSILTVLAAFLLCGCKSAVEPNDLAYVVAVGIDDADGADYDFTLQIANPQAISGGSSEEGGEGGRETVTDITITAPTVFSAVNIANHLYSKQLSLAHTKLIAVSEELARGEGLSEFGAQRGNPPEHLPECDLLRREGVSRRNQADQRGQPGAVLSGDFRLGLHRLYSA